MKFMAVWKIRPEHQREAIDRFLKGGAPAPEGMTILDRWHVPGSQRGFVLIETDDLTAHGAHMVEWGNNLELEVYPVYDDADAGMAMTKGVAAAAFSRTNPALHFPTRDPQVRVHGRTAAGRSTRELHANSAGVQSCL